jgi:hypothetical protein
MAHIDRLIGPVAAGQLGLVTRRQLLDLGLTRRQIDHRRADSRLIDVHPAVYRMAGLPPSYERDVLAACLATGGVASNRSAARLFALRGFERYRRTIEITVEGRAARLPGVVAHSSSMLERTRIGVIPVTMPMQTLVDLAHVEARMSEGALNHALGRGLVRLPALVGYLDDVGQRPGRERLKALVELQIKGERPTASWLEDRVLEFLRGLGLPEPVRQYPIILATGKRILFDFAFPARRLGIEADSRIWHSTPADRRRDLARDQAAAAVGWETVRIRWLDLQERVVEIGCRLVPRVRAA